MELYKLVKNYIYMNTTDMQGFLLGKEMDFFLSYTHEDCFLGTFRTLCIKYKAIKNWNTISEKLKEQSQVSKIKQLKLQFDMQGS